MTKSPADVLDFDIDFARWLTTDDRIVGAVATISGSNATVDRTDHSDTAAKVWVSGGVDGETGHISVVVTTLEERIKEFCFHLKIRECR
jgi:hypothetical protein